jgi:hypothetical protein
MALMGSNLHVGVVLRISCYQLACRHLEKDSLESNVTAEDSNHSPVHYRIPSRGRDQKILVYSFLKECHILLGEELADVVSGRVEVRIGGHISRKYIYPSSEIDGRVWEPRGRGDLEGVET